MIWRAPMRWLAALSLYGVVTAIVTWPVLRAAGGVVSHPPGDPLLNVWILWWNLQELPLTSAWWNAPMFFPTPGTMAFSELLLGLLPITAPIQWWSDNPVLAYNAAVILSFLLSALAAHALALELTGRHDAALLAGLAFGFCAYRGGEFGHVQMLSYYWAPVALLALHRLAVARSLESPNRTWVWLVVFAGACLLQVLCNGYSLFHLPVLIVLWMIWFCRTSRDALRIALASMPIALVLLPILAKYREVHAPLHLTRSIGDIREFSADIAGLLSAPPESLLYGDLLTAHQAAGLFPGVTVIAVLIAGIVKARVKFSDATYSGIRMHNWIRWVLLSIALAAAGVAASVWVLGPWAVGSLTVSQPHKPLSIAIAAAIAYFAIGPGWRRVWRERSLTAFYAFAAAVFYVLSFGPEPRLFGHRVFYKAPYAWLMELPGFDAVRSPARFAMLAVLSVAVLVALIYARWRSAPSGSRTRLWIPIAAGLIAEGLLVVNVAQVPPLGPGHPWTDVSAVIELPVSPEHDAGALYRSMMYGVPVVNGTSGYVPPHYPALASALANGEVAAIQELARYGSIGIAIDRSFAGNAALERSVRALNGITPISDTRAWATFISKRSEAASLHPGESIAINAVRASRNSGEIHHVLDSRLETVWSSTKQDGDEEVSVELAGEQPIAGVILRHGPCPFGFPRDLAIDTSLDQTTWKEVWRGGTAVATVRGALASPSDVPLAIGFETVTARYVRLRQLGRDRLVPWCIAELSIHR